MLAAAVMTAPARALDAAAQRRRVAVMEQAEERARNKTTTLVMHALGDCAMGDLQHGAGAPGSFAARLQQQSDPMAYPFMNFAERFAADDLTIANLEGVLTRSRHYHNQVFSIRGEPGYANMLLRAGIELVDIDNNHSDDYGARGLHDTLQALAAVGVAHFGKGHIDVRTLRGVRVTNLGYLGGREDVQPRMQREVAAAHAAGGVVVVSFHWGIEGYYNIHPLQRQLGRAAIDAGADLVLGHHPHVLQGVERYRGRHIVYSLGNFVFGANSQPKDTDSMVARMTFRVQHNKVVAQELSLIAISISSQPHLNDFRPRLLSGKEGRRVLAKVARLSAALNTPRHGD